MRDLHARLRPHVARPEVHHHVLLYLQAILSDIPRKNGWQIAEQARQARPDGIQRLLSQAVWDQDGVRDDLRTFVCQTLHPPALVSAQASPAQVFPVFVLDESAFPKRGRHSAGVGPQYCGLTGRVENCQVGVFLCSVTERSHALIDRELYLPEDWCADLPRRHAAHIPDAVSFQTKPELARRMVQRAQEAGLPIGWVVADTVYGHSPELRRWLQEHGHPYALAVPSTEVVCVQTHVGDLLLADVARIAQQGLPARAWQRLSQSLGTKGERLFDWARLPVAHAGAVDGQHWLVVRRCLDDSTQMAFFLVWAPLKTPLATMVQAIGARWHIEEDLHTTKALGLDQYEVRSFQGWYRHITLVLLASAFLVSITVQASLMASACSAESPACAPLIPFTPSEVQHLLAHLFFPAPTSAPLICQWSWWRRTHQYWAGYYHRRRREKIGYIGLTSPKKPVRTCQEKSEEFSRHMCRPCSRTQLLGTFPGVCLMGSRSCCPSPMKGGTR
ncbi:MAG: IS701 family transposase [Chloroflexota bacterium]|nr:IS701 family transposase [Chloroflexota bacterium]